MALDNTPPSLSPTVVTPMANPNNTDYPCPAPGSTVPVSVQVAASDDKSGVKWIGVGLDTSHYVTATQSGSGQPWQATVNVPPPIGPHHLYVKASDNAANVATTQTLVQLVDTATPVLTVTVPQHLIHDNSPVSAKVSGTVVDSQTGVSWVKVSLISNNGTALVTDQVANIAGPHGPSQQASWSTTLNVPDAGTYTVSVRASDNNSPNPNVNATPQTAQLTVEQIPQPVPTITSPKNNDVIPGTDQGAVVTVKGTATAPLSSLTLVEVSVDNGAFVRALPGAANDWSQWSAQVNISAQGSHTITVRCKNSASNPAYDYGTARVTVTVGIAYKPQDLEDNISPLAYLGDLLKFAEKRVDITGGNTTRNLTVGDLVQQFHQPFDQLNIDEQLLQIRICIEVLRKYLASAGKTLAPDDETRYSQVAYQALLTQLGTSYDELRRIRSASAEKRQALAARLGLDLAASRPDQLDLSGTAGKPTGLLLEKDQITEANLEYLFGLADTTRADPLSANVFPKLLDWQMDHLHTTWQAQDHPASADPSDTVPIIDPDLVSKDDLLSPVAGNQAYDLWQTRSTWVANQLARLANDRVQGESDQARVDRLVSKVIAPASMNDLLDLNSQLQQGHDVTAQLSPYRLSLPFFTFLIHLHGVASAGALLDTEWNDLYSLLVQVMKLGQYNQWRAEEAGLVLGPNYFKIADEAPGLPAWRATTQARRNWEQKLQARMDQQEAVRQAFLAAVRAAEAIALPILRDALVGAVGAAPGVDVPNWLTERLMIDVKSSSSLVTTRVTQAIETIQGILTALRTGRLMEPVPATKWSLTEPNTPVSNIGAVFDQEWTWMGTFATWQAAMCVFLYPENLLLPTLLKDAATTGEFAALLETMRSAQPVTPKVAHVAAAQYLRGMEQNRQVADALTQLAPDWQSRTFVLDEQIEEADLPARAAAIQNLITRNNGAQPLQRYLLELFYFVPVQLGIYLHKAGQFTAALDWFRTVYGYNLPTGQRKVAYNLTQEEQIQSVYQTTDQWLRTALNPHDIAPMRAGAYTRFTILSIVQCFLDYADSEFASDSEEAVARARLLYLSALDLLGSRDMELPQQGGDPAAAFGFASNPLPQAQQHHAELSLYKLRNGRNIAGMQWQASAYAAPNTALASAMLGTSALQPTPYRYAVLIERAKQLVALAQQMETSYLSSLEKQDAESYNLQKAGYDLSVAQANVQLQDLRVTEVYDGVALATLQQSRAQLQQDTYQQWIDAGPMQAERDLLQNYRDANEARNWIAGLDAAITAAQALTSATSGGFLGTGLGAGDAMAVAVGVLAEGKNVAQVALNNAEAAAQANAFQASYERREQEWQLQHSLAQKDVAIGAAQVQQARDNVHIATQEHVIAQMQASNAAATVNFLANKFTNVELYEWMSGILGRVYSYFLQQATAIARLAQNQLAFERQEKPLSLIQADYWQASTDASTPGGSSGAVPDRRGLTGSARLLEDIYQLDQYAFETNKRKLQLTKTISLAQLAPIEFQQFRQTSVLMFATPTELFDRDFPGHYLRLIKRVRTSVIALIPPSTGIRATLSTSGLSRVTIGNPGFQTVVVRRDPELIALSSPLNATGLFELDTQSDMLLPFEGLGVDTSWRFEMPKAANPFDFSTIADVLIAVEYTALHSFDYRQQVIQRLGRTLSSDRVLSLRRDFVDQWYELNNPAQSSTPMTVQLTTTRGDFPVNVAGLSIQQVMLYFIRADDADVEISVTNLQFAPDGGGGPYGGPATTIDGAISTRRGNASSWLSMIQSGAAPVGTWSLTLPNTPEMTRRFTDGDITDILLAITYRGLTPAWPA